jgi:hypothetical protein
VVRWSEVAVTPDSAEKEGNTRNAYDFTGLTGKVAKIYCYYV